MARINLLPWRQELRQERQQKFLVVMAFTALVGMALVGLGYFYYWQMISGQNNRNNFLTTKINEVERKIEEIKRIQAERERLIEQINTIQNLQQERPRMVKLYDVIPRVAVPGMFFTEVMRIGNRVVLRGYSESNPRVASMLRNIEKSNLLYNAQTDFIRLDEDKKTSIKRMFEVSASMY